MNLPRFRPHVPAEQDNAQAKLREAILSGPRARATGPGALTDADGGLVGPFGPMLLSPALGHALQELGAQVRYGTQLDDALRELAVLAVAAHEQSAFEQYAHEPLALAAGLSADVVQDLRAGRLQHDLDPTQELVLDVVTAVLAGNDLTDELFARATKTLGERGLYELLTLVGYYRLLALQMRVLHVEPRS